MVCYDVLCCGVLSCVVMCCVIASCAAVCCVVLYCVVLCCVVLFAVPRLPHSIRSFERHLDGPTCRPSLTEIWLVGVSRGACEEKE